MTLSLDTGSFLTGSEMSSTGSPLSPLSGSRRGSSTKLHKSPHHSHHHHHHRRKNSTTSGSGGASPLYAPSPTLSTAFPSFDPTYGTSTTYMTANPPSEPVLLFARSSSNDDHGGSSSSSSAFAKKIKPLVRHTPSGSREPKSVPIDLNMSKAENEQRGAYVVSDMPTTDMPASARNALGGHARTISGTSQLTVSSTHSTAGHHHRSSNYVHPARQLPSVPTPPIPSAPFAAPGERPSSSRSDLANVPALPPPGHYRPSIGGGGGGGGGGSASGSASVSGSGGGILRSNTSTPPCINSPTSPVTAATAAPSSSAAILSTSVPTTSRNSIDSSFRDRIAAGLTNRHRSRTNSNAPMDPDDEIRAVAALRADFNAREAAKDEKYRRREEKRDKRRSEAEERKARRRRGNSGATAGSTGSGIAASSMSGASVRKSNTGGGGGREGYDGAGRNSSRHPSEKDAAPTSSMLEGIRYDSTAPERRPTMGTAAPLDDFDEKAESIPKRGKKQGFGSASKATQSLWMTFWFRVKTALLRMMSSKSK